MRARSVTRTALGILWLCVTPSIALAEPTTTEKATAEALYDQGRDLMKQGRYAEACPKLAESQRLDSGVGTLLYLGDCYEQTNRTASAWVTFREAIAAARAAHQTDREAIAERKAAALEPRLARLTVSVPVEARPPGLVVKRDGIAIGDASFDVPTPVDPGEHTIEASAPGRRAFKAPITIATAEQRALTITPLEVESSSAPSAIPPAQPAAAAPPVAAAQDKPEGGVRTITWVAFGVGAAGVVTGAVTGILAFSSASAAKEHCVGNDCTPDAQPDIDKSTTLGTISTIAFIVGGVGAGVGLATLFLGDGAKRTSSARFPSARFVVTPGGFSIRGGF
jgi:hypothetical protein